jgi:hypothetical protein
MIQSTARGPSLSICQQMRRIDRHQTTTHPPIQHLIQSVIELGGKTKKQKLTRVVLREFGDVIDSALIRDPDARLRRLVLLDLCLCVCVCVHCVCVWIYVFCVCVCACVHAL